ncbi:MAG: glycosyltransferase family 4 protein [Bacteroidia bacterium]
MRIAFVTDGIFPLVLGGMQRHSYYMVKYLANHQIHVTLIHCKPADQMLSLEAIFSESELAFIDAIELEFPNSNHLPGHYVYDSYRYSKQVFEVLKPQLDQFDFIYAKGFTAWYLIKQKQKNQLNWPPIGIKFHGYEMFQKQANFKSYLTSVLLAPFVKWNTKHADYVFSYGGKITNIIQSLGVNKDKIIEIPSGIEPEWLQANNKLSASIKFVFMGRYERRKGIEELNQVLQLLLNKQLPFECHFIGPIPKDKQIHSDAVKYHGVVTNSHDMQNILDQMDVLICPSWSEGMPNVIIEAMSRSCAIIASDVGAVSELVKPNNGLTINPGDQKALHKAMLNFISLPKKELQNMQNNALQHIQSHFIYDTIIKQFISKIQSIHQS